jgi:hypothetical protein
MPFAKHETFYLRDGWLYKGLKAVQEDELIFLSEDAPQRLGLGKNMVRALRFWMQATGVAYERLSKRGKSQFLTPFGEAVLRYDPYQELEGTLWLLHHQLVCSKNHATTWYWFFNHYAPLNFGRQEFVERLGQWVNTQTVEDEALPAEGSLIRDFDCLVHTYVPSQRDRSPEDLMESPLASLGLITSTEHQDEEAKRVRHYRLLSSPAATVAPLVFLYVLMKRQEVERESARQVALTVALREPMNVGRTFNIGIQVFEEIIGHLQDNHPDLSVTLTRTGGLDQINLPSALADEVLSAFYERNNIAEDVRTWSFPIN